MHTESPYFKKPLDKNGQEDENAKIWRYMSLEKFISLLDKKALFFRRGDRLTDKFDKFEGSLTKACFERMNNSRIQKIFSNDPQKKVQMDNNRSIFWKELKKWFVINCWHINEYESDAMWQLYAARGLGIAIQTTFKQLVESFREDKEYKELIGTVEYIDYDNDLIQHPKIFYPYLFKRKSFSHERELRVIITKVANEWIVRTKKTIITEVGGELKEKKETVSFEPESGSEPFKNDLFVPVDLNALISEVYVCPTAKESFYEMTKLIMKQYSLNKNPKKSSLASDPIC